MDFINLIKVEAIFLLFQLKQFERSIRMIYYRHEKIKHEQYVCVWSLFGYKAHKRGRRQDKIRFTGIRQAVKL
jgi:hypothetical protein